LLDNFSRARFSYYDALQLDSGEWLSDWQHGDRLPDLVRLSVVTDGSAESEAFDLIVPIRATVPSGFKKT
jgi:hypothetical protein